MTSHAETEATNVGETSRTMGRGNRDHEAVRRGDIGRTAIAYVPLILKNIKWDGRGLKY
jgi:hypothetical protein